MSEQIIDLGSWLSTPAGQYLLGWEQHQVDAAVADVFGYHALQLGLPQLRALRANRMPHQWLALTHDNTSTDGYQTTDAATHSSMKTMLETEHTQAQTMQAWSPKQSPALYTDFAALPFSANSLDLLVLPHSLELSADPHATLREAERVLVPDGRVVICGLNPTSLWAWAQRRGRVYQRLGFGQLYLPDGGEFIGYWRLRDWLRLLGMEAESSSFGCYRPAVRSQAGIDRSAWMDALGPRYWPILGAAYCITAVKRVRGTRLLEATWKRAPRRATAPVSVAPRAHSIWTNPEFSLKNPDEHD
jgi:SAM-dependent methyltransferase